MLLLNMIEEKPENNDKNSEKQENSKTEKTVCNFEKSFPTLRYFVTNLMNQLETSKAEYINVSHDNVSGNKKHTSDLGEEHMGPWTVKSSLNIWSSNSSKKVDKSAQEDVLFDNVKKKKRIKDCDRLDLALNYTSCVNTDTFEYKPNSCFYIRFKHMVRGISDQNKKIRMNGFSQFIRGRMKTRADIVNECQEAKNSFNKFSLQTLLDEADDSATHDHPARRSHPPNRSWINKKSKDASTSAQTTKHVSGKVNESLQERHKSNSAHSSPGLADLKTQPERLLNRERLKDNTVVKKASTYVYAEPAVKIASKGHAKSTPSIPSKNASHTSNNATISCFGKSMSISSVLPPIAQKTSNSRTGSRKK